MSDWMSCNNRRTLTKLKNTSTEDENGVEPDSYRRLSPDLYSLFVIRENPVTMATGNLRRGLGWMTIAVPKFEGKWPPSFWVCPSLTGRSSTPTSCGWVWTFCSCLGSSHTHGSYFCIHDASSPCSLSDIAPKTELITTADWLCVTWKGEFAGISAVSHVLRSYRTVYLQQQRIHSFVSGSRPDR